MLAAKVSFAFCFNFRSMSRIKKNLRTPLRVIFDPYGTLKRTTFRLKKEIQMSLENVCQSSSKI
jgi:hypothetical protein